MWNKSAKVPRHKVDSFGQHLQYRHIGHRAHPNGTNEMQSTATLVDPKEFPQTFSFVKKVIREKLLKADYPKAFINNVISDNETKQSNKNNDDAEEAEMIILKGLFKQPKGFIMFEIPTVMKMSWLQNVFFTPTTLLSNGLRERLRLCFH